MLVYPTLQVKCKSVFGSLVYLSNSDGIDNLVDNLRNIGILCVLMSWGGGKWLLFRQQEYEIYLEMYFNSISFTFSIVLIFR